MTLEGAGTKFKKIFGRSKASVEIEPS